MAELFPFAYFTVMNRSMLESVPLAPAEMEMFGMNHAEIGANWLKSIECPPQLVEAVLRHETPARLQRRNLLGHALVSANQLVRQIGIGYSGNAVLDPRPWGEMPSTQYLWEARGNKEYEYEDFTQGILSQFGSFPDLL
jgi:hypothetical protein